MNIVISTTWNSVELVQAFIDHYRSIGFARMLVMDFGSTDGTLDVLRSARNQDFLQLAPFPGLANLDSSELMLRLARTSFQDATGCLFCDPDELLILPPDGMSALDGVEGSTVIPRYNVTARQSAIVANQSFASVFKALNLRVDQRVSRNVEIDINAETLQPSWIFTNIPGKAFTRLGDTIHIADGDHGAVTLSGKSSPPPRGAYLLHFPMRTYLEFQAKIGMYEVDFASNPHLPEGYGWQARRWVRMKKAGDLYGEYLDQFVADAEADRLLREGVLVQDSSAQAASRT